MAENNRVGQQDDPVPPIVPPPHNQAAQPRLRDIQRPVIAVNPSCIQLSDAARNYELKTFHMNMLPTFNGLGSEDALGFMRELYSTVQTLPLNNLSEEELRMKCIPYCMRGDARQWLLNLPEGSLRTWDDVYNAFMFKYYSSQKTMDYRSKICTFTQREAESLVDTAAGGFTGDKNSDELEAIFESLASNSRQKAVRDRRAVVHEISTQSELTTQMAELTKQINLLMTRDSSNREFSHHNHLMRKLITWDPIWVGNNQGVIHFPIPIIQVGETILTSHGEIKVMQDQWDHLDFSNKDHQDSSISNTDLSSSHLHHNSLNSLLRRRLPQLEEMFMQYMASQDTMMKKMDAKIDKVAQSNQASIHNLEVQVGQLAKLVAEKDRGKFPSTTEINPREGVMAVTLRSGKILNEVMKEKEPTSVEKESDKEEEQVPKENSSDQNLTSSTINIPFAEALANMSSYAKYIKEIVSNKKRLEEFATVHLNEDINLMPLTLFKKLKIAEMKPTTISLQLADRSVKYPLGVVEDILVKVGKFYFPTDFLILDMGSDTDTSLILGRPFF
ncbi:PREDICTED: uncharacterized protein LOC109160613 [Ipomoea nil]|uniref:uncharacterized protein LOC109160613 n=1 Tax=Ipomoea nil TaxID=35883 RepID=UPI000900963A|nr:PREDICTED: uncharacterized protein LOC109160613 [Ipomoea nil]